MLLLFSHHCKIRHRPHYYDNQSLTEDIVLEKNMGYLLLADIVRLDKNMECICMFIYYAMYVYLVGRGIEMFSWSLSFRYWTTPCDSISNGTWYTELKSWMHITWNGQTADYFTSL